MGIAYQIHGNRLEIALNNGGNASIEFDGDIKTSLVLGECLLVLFRASKESGEYSKNIHCYTSTGKFLWAVDAPNVEDSWVHLNIEDGKLIANSWGTFECEIDLDTGEAKNCVFTK